LTLTPEPGLVIRYDFLWKHESQDGQEHGLKDRPCAIILASTVRDDGSRDIVLCPITHNPPEPGQNAVEIPLKVALHLGLDDVRSWIKTHEVNTLVWEQDRIPFGVTKARDNQWAFGKLPFALGKQAFDHVREHARFRRLKTTKRDNDKTIIR
jgi:hypothetical protein